MSIAITDIEKLATLNPQQVGPNSMKVYATFTGQYVVRVHEVLDREYQKDASRYVISVNLKFRELDALRPAGWIGWTRSEAMKEAKDLVSNLASVLLALQYCNDERNNLKGLEYLKRRHYERIEKMLQRYSCEIE